MVSHYSGGGAAHASLINNGGGLIYDTDLNITWYDATPALRNWSDSLAWAAGLTVGNTTSGSWRLPSTPKSTIVGSYTNAGEMGHLYYDELGNPAGGPFVNLMPTPGIHEGYWSGTEINFWDAYFVDFGLGRTDYDHKFSGVYSLAVHEGNVVPVPGAIWLLGSGVVALAGTKIRRKK